MEARIQNILNDVLERPSPDVALARAASQYEHEDLMGSCDKVAEFFADTSSLDCEGTEQSRQGLKVAGHTSGHPNSKALVVNSFLYQPSLSLN